MNLLTDSQIQTATTPDLYNTLNTIEAHLRKREENNLLEAASACLATHNATKIAKLIIFTSSWDNGLFYDTTPDLQDDEGAHPEVPEEVLNALTDAIDPILTHISYLHAPLSDHDELTVDLITQAVTRN